MPTCQTAGRQDQFVARSANGLTDLPAQKPTDFGCFDFGTTVVPSFPVRTADRPGFDQRAQTDAARRFNAENRVRRDTPYALNCRRSWLIEVLAQQANDLSMTTTVLRGTGGLCLPAFPPPWWMWGSRRQAEPNSWTQSPSVHRDDLTRFYYHMTVICDVDSVRHPSKPLIMRAGVCYTRIVRAR
uniref:Uncharacterized protein n=1 Tax=Anopheles melas TaxID=34690 RepID=A0A182UAQ1_9DIPT